MRLFVAEVPAAPALGFSVLALGACFAFVFLWTFDKAFRLLFAPLLTRVAKIGFGGVSGHFGAHPFHFLQTIVEHVEQWTRDGMAGSEHAISYGFGAALWAFYDLCFTVAKIGYDFNSALDNVWHNITSTTPKVIRETIVKPIKRTVTITKAVSSARLNQLDARVRALTAHVAQIAATIPHEIALAPARVGITSKQVRRLTRRLSRVEKATVGIGAIALVTGVLGRLGLSCLLGRNGKKAVGSLCKISPSLLDALLLDVVALSVAFNLEEFAREMQGVTEEAARLIHNFAD